MQYIFIERLEKKLGLTLDEKQKNILASLLTRYRKDEHDRLDRGFKKELKQILKSVNRFF